MSLPLISADDWGLSPGINEGILDLVRKGIVQRVSILASGSFVGNLLPDLKAVPGLILGLHFSLTIGVTHLGGQVCHLAIEGRFNLSPHRVALLHLLSGFILRKKLAKEVNLLLREQLTILQDYGVYPRFLDGHHHIHLVPGIMESMLPVLKESGIAQVRVPWDPDRLLSRISPIILLALYARVKWPKRGLTFLPFVYPSTRDYRNESSLRHIVERKGGYEMVVHPASYNDVSELRIPDKYAGDRVREYQVLCSLESLFK